MHTHTSMSFNITDTPIIRCRWKCFQIFHFAEVTSECTAIITRETNLWHNFQLCFYLVELLHVLLHYVSWMSRRPPHWVCRLVGPGAVYFQGLPVNYRRVIRRAWRHRAHGRWWKCRRKRLWQVGIWQRRCGKCGQRRSWNHGRASRMYGWRYDLALNELGRWLLGNSGLLDSWRKTANTTGQNKVHVFTRALNYVYYSLFLAKDHSLLVPVQRC